MLVGSKTANKIKGLVCWGLMVNLLVSFYSCWTTTTRSLMLLRGLRWMMILVYGPERMGKCRHAFDISPGVQSSFLGRSMHGYERLGTYGIGSNVEGF